VHIAEHLAPQSIANLSRHLEAILASKNLEIFHYLKNLRYHLPWYMRAKY